jgi:hypothetical protein
MRAGALYSMRSASPRRSPPKPALPPPSSSRSLAVADLLQEIEKIRSAWTKDDGLLRRMEQSLREGRGELDSLRQSLEQLRREMVCRLDEIERRQSVNETLLREWIDAARRR